MWRAIPVDQAGSLDSVVCGHLQTVFADSWLVEGVGGLGSKPLHFAETIDLLQVLLKALLTMEITGVGTQNTLEWREVSGYLTEGILGIFCPNQISAPYALVVMAECT